MTIPNICIEGCLLGYCWKSCLLVFFGLNYSKQLLLGGSFQIYASAVGRIFFGFISKIYMLPPNNNNAPLLLFACFIPLEKWKNNHAPHPVPLSPNHRFSRSSLLTSPTSSPSAMPPYSLLERRLTLVTVKLTLPALLPAHCTSGRPMIFSVFMIQDDQICMYVCNLLLLLTIHSLFWSSGVNYSIDFRWDLLRSIAYVGC